MNIVLIGKHGQLGSGLKQILLSQDFEVHAYSHHDLDITDYQHIQQMFKKIQPDIVINTSAYHVLGDCEKYPERAFAVNTYALKNLAEECSKQNIKLITYSTDYVFDGTKGEPYVEDDRPNPLQMYGLSKLAGEIACINYNPNSIVIRTCGLYGGLKGSKQKGGNFVITILEESKHNTTIDVSTEQIVSPTYAGNLAERTVELLQNNSARGIYHLVNEGYCSWYEFAKEIVRLKKLKLRIKPIDRGGTYVGIRRPLFSALVNTRAKSVGVSMPSWENGLKEYLSYITNK